MIKRYTCELNMYATTEPIWGRRGALTYNHTENINTSCHGGFQ